VLHACPGNLGTSLLIDPEAGATEFESFWESEGLLVNDEDVIAACLREAALPAGGTVIRDRYGVLVFERDGEAEPGRAGQQPEHRHGGRGRCCGGIAGRDRRREGVPAGIQFSTACLKAAPRTSRHGQRRPSPSRRHEYGLSSIRA
jgi:hypothetical protein